MNKPKYPIYIPSKNRADVCLTARFFLKDGVDFKLVVEPSQAPAYEKIFGKNQLLILPKDDMKLLGSRLWIREHSIQAGFSRHWQFDDNIRGIRRLHKGRRIRCDSNFAIKLVEDFTDRYLNIGISGFNYYMFVPDECKKPITINTHVYSASLINNEMPYKWRLMYNDDTDLCLQVVTNNMCTVSFNAFHVEKMQTMIIKGGNTDDLYQKDGRLRMARTLEEMWPEYVTVKKKFGRAQHHIKDSWKCFKTPLIRRPDLDWEQIKKTEYKLELRAQGEVKSEELKKLLKESKK